MFTAAHWDEKLKSAEMIPSEFGTFKVNELEQRLDRQAFAGAASLIEEMRDRVAQFGAVMQEISDHRVIGPLFTVGPGDLPKAAHELFRLSQGEKMFTDEIGPNDVHPDKVVRIANLLHGSELPMTHDSQFETEDYSSWTVEWIEIPEEHRAEVLDVAVAVAALVELYRGERAQGHIVELAEDFGGRLPSSFAQIEELRSRLSDAISSPFSSEERLDALMLELEA